MDPVSPDTMPQNIYDLPNLIETHVLDFSEKVVSALDKLDVAAVKKVFLVGDGDSFHASLGSEMAFESIAGIPCEVASGQKFLDYKAPFLLKENKDDYLVVGISASGSTRRVINSLKTVKELGIKTLAVTGREGSAITEIADSSVVMMIPRFPPSPGIRSYVASLLGLVLIATQLGWINKRYSESEKDKLVKELLSLSDVMKATIESAEEVAKSAANAFKDKDSLIFIGSGPSYGTAVFSAAKIIEACGVFSMGQDLEEWSHVEFFAYPDDMPAFIIAPSGRSFWRALETAEMTKSYGHPTVVITSPENEEILKYADYVFPVQGAVREEFSPFVYHIGVDFFAYFLTKELNRYLFKSDNREFQKLNEAYQKRDRIR
jgi:glucosamine--fructose-6-phosphate aminotransferase (isomerizing)